MEIGFFEEFPDDNNLSKIKLLDFSSVVYAAANSFKDFVTIRNKIKKMNSKIEVAYWPVLEKSYWISPFSYNFELRGLYRDLLKNRDKKTLKVLLDLELPFLNPRLFFINLPDFFINKKLIEKIFTESKKLNIEILTAEYPSIGKITKKGLELLGLSYSLNNYSHKKIIMVYPNKIKIDFILQKMKKNLIKYRSNFSENVKIGLGTIAHGSFKSEGFLKPKDLEKELSFYKKNNFDSIVIFRLGGLNQSYLKKIKKFL